MRRRVLRHEQCARKVCIGPQTGREMTEKRKISAREVIFDTRKGMTNNDLMHKYGLSPRGLASVFKKLLAAHIILEEELEGRIPVVAADTVEVEKARAMSRNYPVVTLPVYDIDDITTDGQIMDITERGLQVLGLNALVGDRKSLLIQADDFADVYPFVFEAECRWVRSDPEIQAVVAGFEITNISDGGLQELRKLIPQLTLGD